jgi:sortase A
MRLKNLILIVAVLATVVALAGCGSQGQSGSDQQQQGDQQKEQKAQKQETPDKQVAPEQGSQDSGDKQDAVDPPSNDMMKLTVPQMEMIKDDEIPTGLGTDETLFHDYAGVHIKHTGFPWEKQANVYIAGHRLGFPNTDSHLAFWDLNKLED